MNGFNVEENESESGDFGRFEKYEGDILYRWTDERERRRRLVKFIFGSIMGIATSVYIGAEYGKELVSLFPPNAIELASNILQVLLPVVCTVLGYTFSKVASGGASSSNRDSFQDIDLRARKKEQLSLIKLNNEIEKLRSTLSNGGGDKQYERKDYFESYVLSLIQTLDKHVTLAEEKASKLLDTGTKYLRRGIYFYIVSIIVWQVAFHYWGGTTYMIYGIASCSITFLVVEFLAAWFLRQYRSFVESSMQFMKVRSVFDRYLLSYYSLKEFGLEDGVSMSESRSLMLKVLEEKAGWPETVVSTADVNHMVQMFSSVSDLLEKIKPTKSGNAAEKG